MNETGHVGGYVGTPGERMRLALTVHDLTYLDTDYQLSTLVTYHDDDGNVIKWFATSLQEPEIGSRQEYEFTVKRHVDFSGSPETQVTRVVPYRSPAEKKTLAKRRAEARATFERLQAESDVAWDALPTNPNAPGADEAKRRYEAMRDAAQAAYRAWKAL